MCNLLTLTLGDCGRACRAGVGLLAALFFLGPALSAQSSRDTRLLNAAARGDAPSVSTLLGQGANPNAVDLGGLTPLHHAAKVGHAPILQALLKAGAKTETRDPNGFTALAIAASLGHAAAVQALAQAGADPNAATRSGATPMMFAALNGHTAAVTALLKAKANLHAQSPAGINALMMAANAGQTHAAAQLVHAGADLNARDASGRTALMLAAAKGHSDTVRTLLSAGADLNLANKWGDTALTWAATEGRTAVVQTLLAAKANVAARNEQGATALLLAARGGFLEMIRPLLNAGAQVNETDANQRTALMFASFNGRNDVVAALLDAGADPNLQDNKGQTALMHAATQGHAPVLQALLQAGANPNARTNTQSTALMSAAYWGRREAVQVLLEAGADSSLRDAESKTAAQLATEQGHRDIAGLIAAAPPRAVPVAPVSAAKQAEGKPARATTPSAEPTTTAPAVGQSPSSLPTFHNIAEQAGITFQHTNGATPEKYMPETMGSGGLFFDFDGDGWLDIFLMDGGSLVDPQVSRRARTPLFRNNGDGTFTDVTARSGIQPLRYGMGACAADYDNDGRVDLYLTGFEGNALYRNNGDGTFTEVTAQASAGFSSWSTSCAWGDFNKDGFLDLYLANYVDFGMNNNQFCGDVVQRVRAYCHPNVYGGLADVLLQNNGDGTFTDISKKAGIANPAGNGLGVVVGDYDNDGWPDIYVANDSVPNFLYRNLGNGTFEEVGQWAGVAVNRNGRPEAGMGTDLGDIDNDGLLDIFVTNLDWETNTLYHNQGKGLFADATAERGLGEPSLPFVGFGTAFFDFDHDGLLDLVVANGNVLDNAKFFRDAASYAQPKHLYRNLGGGKFREIHTSLGPGFATLTVGRGLAVGDIDHDGDLDILITNNGQPPELLRNDGGNRRASLLIRTVGQKSNRDGVGARITVTAGGLQQIREVKAGSSYLGQNDLRVHFGLGHAALAEKIEIRWPSGIVDVLENVAANQILTVTEGKGITAKAPFTRITPAERLPR
jgi:ankyrin repeat protein